MRVVTTITALVCALTIGVVATQAQQGRQGGAPTNLQVLPSDMTTQQVTAQMQNIRQALGVQCTHCHVGGPADRASDDKPQKTMARNMMRMVNNLNEMMGGTAEEPKVTCFTCHRGALKPAIAPDGGLPTAGN